MGVIRTFLIAGKKSNLEVAKRTEELYWTGLSFNASLRQAKEEYQKLLDFRKEYKEIATKTTAK